MIGGDPDVEKELLGIFLESSEECLTALRQNTSNDADKEWRDQAHAWKGMSLNLGAENLGKLCAAAQLHEGWSEDVKKEKLAEIEREYDLVKAFLSQS